MQNGFLLEGMAALVEKFYGQRWNVGKNMHNFSELLFFFFLSNTLKRVGEKLKLSRFFFSFSFFFPVKK